MSALDAVLLDEADQVATVLHPIEPGEVVLVAAPQGQVRVIATEPIPIFHKIAIKRLGKGADALKFGDSIGVLSADVDEGASRAYSQSSVQTRCQGMMIAATPS